MRIIILFLVFVFVLCVPSFAQDDDVIQPNRRGSKIIDDTTKQVYGPRTSKYYYEEDVFLNRPRLYQVDTAIFNFHQFNDVERNENLYQDLGTIGTAIRPIYYEVPQFIGASSGFNAYDVYWDREKIRYWDTKSPYSNMHVILGGRGRSITRATYSRNISPRWNFGLTYRGLFIDKQISRQGKGDRNARSQYYDFFTTWQSKDSTTYRVFVNFRRGNHEVAELGGVRTDIFDPFPYQEFFAIDAQPRLTEAASSDLRMNFHIFHQYSVGKGLQFYHKLDRFRQGNAFSDRPSSERPGYFDYFELTSDTTKDYTRFKTFRNEVGIKGSLAKLFYNGFVAFRKYDMMYRHDTLLNNESQALRTGTETYLGGRIALYLDSLTEVGGFLEVMQSGNYRIEGKITSKWLEANLRQVQYEPSFLQQYYRGATDFWKNNFSSVNATQLSGFAHYRSSVLKISPGLSFTRIGNYIFFKSIKVEGDRVGSYTPENIYQADVMPVQTSGDQVIINPMLRAELILFRHMHVRTFAVYSKLLQESQGAIQQPQLFINGQVSYANIFFNGNLDMHAGVDVHWKSAYYAMGYDVPTQQFFVQGEPDQLNTPFVQAGREGRFKSPAVPVVNLFFNAKIKRARIFVRYNNLLQLATGEGYFPTPFYPGQRNSVDFGFDWSFYD